MQNLDSMGHSLDTHWSRILHYDLYTAHADGCAPDPGYLVNGESGSSASDLAAPSSRWNDKDTSVAPDGPGRGTGSRRKGSAIHAATTRLAIFIAIYVAVAGAVHVLFWPDAFAAVPESLPVPTSVITASNPPRIAQARLQSEASRPRGLF